MSKNTSFLKTRNTSIVDSNGKEIYLRGANLGGWLMMEGYFLYGRNISERSFKKEMAGHYGRKEAGNFTKAFRGNFITEEDFENIARLGFNCIRLPFNYKLLEDENKPFKYKKDGFVILENAVKLCEKYGIFCILDMHAASGSQNFDWHSDSDGVSYLWNNIKHKERFFRLWEFLAHSFKDTHIIAGYDVLNEPVIEKTPKKILRDFYIEAVGRIRKIDPNHIIFLEGNRWSQVIEDIGEPFTDNLSYSIHYYLPLDFTFNFHRGLKYPGIINGVYWDKNRIKRSLTHYYEKSREWNIPIYVGEFGVNLRCCECYGELDWVRDTLECFNEFKFHWTYWTYKAIANSVFPDGLYQYVSNPGWVNRQGSIYGWENFYTLWKSRKKDIIESWHTGNFIEQKTLTNLLASYIPI